MDPSNPYRQIQSRNTPRLYVSTGLKPRQIFDSSRVAARLNSANLVAPLVQVLPPDVGNTSATLAAMILIAPLIETISDSGNTAARLAAMILIAPIVEPVTETGTAAARLNSMPLAVPKTFSFTDTPATAAALLTSMVKV